MIGGGLSLATKCSSGVYHEAVRSWGGREQAVVQAVPLREERAGRGGRKSLLAHHAPRAVGRSARAGGRRRRVPNPRWRCRNQLLSSQ